MDRGATLMQRHFFYLGMQNAQAKRGRRKPREKKVEREKMKGLKETEERECTEIEQALVGFAWRKG